MLNRWAGLILAVVGLIAGYHFAKPGALAQTDPMPFSIGDRVTLRYEVSAEDRFQDVSCVVGAFQGDWVRCESTDRFKTYARGTLQKPYRKAPYPCSHIAVSSRDGYVLDMSPWALSAGLRRGDRVVARGGIPFTGCLLYTSDAADE